MNNLNEDEYTLWDSSDTTELQDLTTKLRDRINDVQNDPGNIEKEKFLCMACRMAFTEFSSLFDMDCKWNQDSADVLLQLLHTASELATAPKYRISIKERISDVERMKRHETSLSDSSV